MLPYGKQTIEQDDIEAVTAALQSDWLTTGPLVDEFENAFALATSSIHAVAVSSGTAALHTAMHAAGIGSRDKDEVIVPAISFVATANASLYLGATPVFADINPDTLLIDPEDVRRKITPNTRAIVAMDYAGQPCDYAALRAIADQHNLILIADACHSLGASIGASRVGSLADFSCFSLHPIKQITAGEGGVVVTNDGRAASSMRAFRNHGIATDGRQRAGSPSHRYAMESLGFNYRLTDIQCALAHSQLKKLGRFTRRRNDVARFYGSLLQSTPFATPLHVRPGVEHAYHLYVVRWNSRLSGISRDEALKQLRERGIGANVHYQPIYQQPYYEQRFGRQTGCCPQAETVAEDILSLPIFVDITESEVRRVVRDVLEVANQNSTLQKKVA